MGLQEDDRKILINLRLNNAKTTLEEVNFLAQNGKWRTAANRLYYACYYAAGALLVCYEITAHTHTGVINQIGLHFVTKGLISLEQGKFYRGLFSLRQSGDYDDWFEIKETDILPRLEPAKKFIETIEKLIHEKEMESSK